jgi:glucose/arabinose dehydrogenase
MKRVLLGSLVALSFACVAMACNQGTRSPISETIGPHPNLPVPTKSFFPTMEIATAKGWPEGSKPTAAPGTKVNAFAGGLDHPRWLYVLPNGDVLVAETNAPNRPDDNRGVKGFITRQMMKRAGSGVPSANRITLLRDDDRDGIAEKRSTFVGGLNSPFGMALVGNDFYVANTDAVVRYRYTDGATKLDGAATRLTELPAGSINHHCTKSLLASPDGNKLYVGIGSNSNAAENGIEAEADRAEIWEIDRASGKHRVFASGLRNPVGLAWQATSKRLWVAVNERDELGNDLVPDYMTSVTDGGFYGWPFSYYGKHLDDRVDPQRPDLASTALVPDYALGAHTASLGLADARGNRLPSDFRDGMFVGQHGSWNRKPPSGYKVIFVPFEAGVPAGMPKDVLTGFLNEKGEALGRPVGVAVARDGSVLVADDVGNTVWRVSATSPE